MTTPHVKSGRLRALAVTSGKRAEALAQVPTIAESGYPDFQVVGWNGLHAPAKTPQAIIEKLNAEAAKYLKISERTLYYWIAEIHAENPSRKKTRLQ